MPSEAESKNARRRRFRFSLRSFLLAVAVLCIVLGMYMKYKRDQQFAIATIKSWGGTVQFDYQPDDRERAKRALRELNAAETGAPAPVFVDPSPPGPQWLRRLLGDHFFANVIVVQTHNSAKKIDLRVLAPLNDIRRLSISYTRVGDDDLRHLGPLTKLEVLHLSATKVTDQGLQHLARLQDLRILSLNYTEVTDAGLVHLGYLKNLKSLELSNTNVTEAGVDELQGALPNCEIRRGRPQPDREKAFPNPGSERYRIAP